MDLADQPLIQQGPVQDPPAFADHGGDPPLLQSREEESKVRPVLSTGHGLDAPLLQEVEVGRRGGPGDSHQGADRAVQEPEPGRDASPGIDRGASRLLSRSKVRGHAGIVGEDRVRAN